MTKIQMSPVGRFERFLLATDGTDYSESAETLAIDIAGRANAHLHIMRAVVDGAWGFFTSGGATPEVEQAAKQLDELMKEAVSHGIKCTMAIPRAADPSEAIVKEARREQVDMIIIGRHERDSITRMLMGGSVIGNAPCPVLVAPKGSHFWQDVVVATDGSRSSDAAVVTAAAMAKCCDVPVTVLSVKVPGHSQRRQDEAENIVSRAAQYLEQEGIDAKGLVAEGHFEDIIFEEEHDGDSLVILGSHGRTGGATKSMFGSRTEGIINRSRGPVLVVGAGP